MTVRLPSRTAPATGGPQARTPPLVLVGVAVLVCLTATLAQPEHHLGLDLPTLLALVSRVVAVVASAGVLGSLLLCLCQPVAARPDRGLLDSASAWAVVWASALAVGFAVELASPLSVSSRVAAGPGTGGVDARFRWLVLGIVLAALVRVLAPAVRSRTDVGTVLAVAAGGLLVGVISGHGGSVLSTSWLALLAHVLAASAWTGGLLALVVHGGSVEPPGTGAPTAHAYSRLALICYGVLAGSGVLGLLSRSSPAALLDSGSYLGLVLVKAGLLLVLGLFGAAQRRRGLACLRAGDRRGFLMMSVGELVVMATAMGLGVTLAHTAS